MHQQINIHAAAAGFSLKEDLKKLSNKLGIKSSSLVNQLFVEALENRKDFGAPLANPRQKNGAPINCRVSEETKKHVAAWAEEVGSSLSLWSNHIIEKGIELKYQKYLNHEPGK